MAATNIFLKQLEMLANGINPINEEALHDSSLMHKPYNIRLIYLLLDELKRTPPTPAKKSKTMKVTLVQQEQENLNNGKPRRYGFEWIDDEITLLQDAWAHHFSLKEIAQNMHRTTEEIMTKLTELDLLQTHEAESFRQRSA